MANKKKRTSLIFIVFGVLLLSVPFLGLALISDNLDAGMGDGSFNTVVTGNIVLKDASGQVINPAVAESSLLSEGAEVAIISVSLGWTTVGTELDWSTFMITANPIVELDDPFGDTSYPPRTKTYPLATSIFQSAVDGLTWDFDLQTEVIDELGADQLSFLTGVTFTFKALLTAQVTDNYGGVHEETANVDAGVILDWQEPTFSFTVSHTFSSGSIFGDNAFGDIAFAVMGATIIVFGVMLFTGKRFKLKIPSL